MAPDPPNMNVPPVAAVGGFSATILATIARPAATTPAAAIAPNGGGNDANAFVAPTNVLMMACDMLNALLIKNISLLPLLNVLKKSAKLPAAVAAELP